MNQMVICDLRQALKMKASEDSNLEEWLKREVNSYISLDIQNEALELMDL